MYALNKDFLKIKNKIDIQNIRKINEAFNFAEKSKFPTEFQNDNFKNTFKGIKKFYDNKISFGTVQDSHKPKPY